MNALFIHEPGRAGLGQLETPNPGPGEVSLRIQLVGLCGSDLSTFRGANPMVSYPRVPGHEVAAIVESVTSDAPFQVGEPVTVSPYTSCGVCPSCLRGRPNACQSNETLGVQRNGAMTEHLTVPSAKVLRAEGLSLRELCLVEPLSVGFHAARRGRVAPEDVVAVLGCGAIGLGAVAGAAYRGAKVLAVDLDDQKLKRAAAAGARNTINSSTCDLHEALLELTSGRGPDVVVEAVGSPATFQSAVAEVAFTGRVVYIGYAKAPVEYNTKLFVQKELDILGSRNALPEDFNDVIAMLQKGRFPVADAISCVVPLQDAPQTLSRWNKNPNAFTKILVEIAPGSSAEATGDAS